MLTIHKYLLPIEDQVCIRMPKHAKVLSVQAQDGNLCMWAAVETTMGTENRHFLVFGTGNPNEFGSFGTFIGTVQLNGFVWHVFDQKEPTDE